MPPKTRTNKAKVSKENACVLKKNKVQKSNKGVKPPRRALADKTNSASDDNTSVLINEKQPEKDVSVKKIQDYNKLDVRPRRARCLPKRYNESDLLKNLSNTDNSQSISDTLKVIKASPVKKKQNTLKKIPIVVVSPLKTPIKTLDNSLLKARPKRICKLPSKFDDHSISPNKFIPVQPINASTPLANKTKNINKEYPKKALSIKSKSSPLKESNETALKQKTLNDFFNDKTADTNNNAKRRRQKPQNSPTKSPSKVKEKQVSPKVKKNASVRVLGDNKKSLKRISNNPDIYEFTYDPEEEPPPTKKKKKKTVAKKATKPKVNIKSNYDKNLAKALAALKNTVSSKPTEQSLQKVISDTNKQVNNKNNITQISDPNTSVNIDKSTVNERNFNSIRVEDIAKDMQVEDDINIDYSPVNSPCRPQTPAETNDNPTADRPNVDDPLNLRDDLSFFDEQPAASSSMNISHRHPHASPWRVEFGNLPIKWQVNTYVKPNMTPAVESSFINFNDTTDKQKKHVYTNMISDQNESIQSLPPIVESTPSLKQTSIISFIKEVVEKKNKKGKSKLTPVKANSLFEDVSSTSITEPLQKKLPLSNKNTAVINLTPIKDTSLSRSNNSSNMSNGTNNLDTEEINTQTPKVQKEKDKNLTYFGFDEIEDQENISPKKKNKVKALRSRTRGILQELNVQKGPTRAVIPVNKSKPVQSSDAVNKLFDGVKSATEPPVFPEVADTCNTEVPENTNIAEPAQIQSVENDDSESVHLFEDIEFLHHHKLSRKSYGKSKKVAFSKTTALDNSSDSSNDVEHASSDEDLDDLSFKLPSEKPKKTIKRKKTNKQKLSKKEEKEVEAWAAGFNSMCEDIDEFDLVVE